MVKPFNSLNLKLSFFLILFGLSTTLFAQENVEYDDEFTYIYSDFSVDHLGNLYTLFENDILTKFVEKGEFEILDYNYSNRGLSEITNFDVTNPLRIIVNHESFSTIVFLDVTLTETAQIFLPDLQIFSNPLAYALANDNTVWLYDDSNLELVRVNEFGERVYTSQNLIQQLGFSPQITDLRANKTHLLAVDAEKGFLVFDSYGMFLRRIIVDEVEQFQLIEDNVLYVRDGKIIKQPLEGIGESVVADLPEGAIKFYIQNKKLYFLNALGVGEIELE